MQVLSNKAFLSLRQPENRLRARMPFPVFPPNSNPKMPYHHTELIRLLEQRHHPFPSDPASITEILRQADGTPEAKLHRRAQLIDRDQHIAQRLAQHQQRLRFARRVACAAWFIIGLLGTYQLMQQSSLNFMLILVGILGGNSLMLIIWLISLTQKYRAPTSIPLWLTGSLKDPIHQALLEHDAQTAAQLPFRWIRSRISHQIALCGLLGMFTASLMLLTVRQYQFNWQSTLLTDQHFAHIIHVLAWLPAQLGIPTPSPSIIAAARNHYHSEHAAQWGILLLASILCYGIIPRLIAWLICWQHSRRYRPTLNLAQPYYQNIIQQWQRQIIDDASDYQPDRPAIAPAKIPLNSAGEHWAILLEAPNAPDNWHSNILGQDWANKGSINERAELARLINELAAQPVQLLIGIRAQQTPDRGIIRQIAQLAQAAQHNIIIQLLPSNPPSPTPAEQERRALWHKALQENGWNGLN